MIVKPDFIIGNEKRFFDFISDIGKKDKVAILSHGEDIDGILTAKIINEVIPGDVIKLLGYEELNDGLISELKKLKITKITLTDMGIPNKEFVKKLESIAPLLIIDHHVAREDYNSEKTVYLNAQGFCNSYLCYYLFSKVKSLEEYDWLVVCASFADWQHEKNREWIKEVYKKYNIAFNDDVKKTKLWDIHTTLVFACIYFRNNPKYIFDNIKTKFGDVDHLVEHEKEVRKALNETKKRFEKEKQKLGNVYYWEFNPKLAIRELVVSKISAENPDKTYVFVTSIDDSCRISARRQDDRYDLSEVIKRLIKGFDDASGGGHRKAAGCHFPKRYLEEFKRRIKEHEF